jgi:cytochrome c oxidase subunit 2
VLGFLLLSLLCESLNPYQGGHQLKSIIFRAGFQVKVETEGSIAYLVTAFVIAFLVLGLVPVWFLLGAVGGGNHDHHGGEETVTEESFVAKLNEQQEKYGLADGSVRPPSDGRVYVMVRQFAFTPNIIRLQAGKSYELAFFSPDVLHGVSLVHGLSLNAVLMPVAVSAVAVRPMQHAEILIVCNEYCGIAHHLMRGKIIVE